MEFLIVSLILVLFASLNSLNYFVFSLATPKNSFFLGTVHWAGDYFYYLSQFAQGKHQWFFSYDLYTSDFKQKTLVGWVNVFLGHLFSLIRIDQLLAYQLSVIIFVALILGLSYLLIREIFPDSLTKRIVSFIFFTAGNAFPRIISKDGGFSFSYYNYWYDNALPFVRLGNVPHQLLAKAAVLLIILIFLLVGKNLEKGKLNLKGLVLYLFSMVILGLMLSSIDPVMWGVVTLVLIVSLGTHFLVRKYRDGREAGKGREGILLGLWTGLFVSGLPISYYLKQLFSKPPYVQLANWEATQQVSIDPIHFILASGPILILAIVGLAFFLKKLTFQKIIAVIFPIVTIGIFFSPLPGLLRIVNVRFLPAATFLFLSCQAAEGVWGLSLKLEKRRKFLVIVLTILVVLIGIPAYQVQFGERLAVDTRNSYYYLSSDAYKIYKDAEKMSNPEDTFLVIWPFNSSFPGITGRRVFMGHHLLTSASFRKDKEQTDFFWGNETSEVMGEFLKKNQIDYVVTYPWTKNIDKIDNLVKIDERGQLALYKSNFAK